MSDTTNADRFLDAYAIIEHEMSEMARETKYVPFSQLLYKCAQHSWIVSKNQQALREYHELRNAIVHLRDGDQEIIAQPTDRATADIERIARLLKKDEKLLSYASTPVKVVGMYDGIRGAWQVMRHLSSSKIPVYGDHGCEGILTMEDVCAWAMNGADESVTVRDLIRTDKKNRLMVVNKDCGIEEGMKAFESALHHGAVLSAILITEHGSWKEKPVGIVTVQDLPQILSELV